MDIPRTWRLQAQRYRLEGTKCTQCGSLSFPPLQICRKCKSRELQSYTFTGRGKIYSYSIVYNAPLQFKEFVPYVVALIDLDEGPRITAQLTDVDTQDVKIGAAVEMIIRKINQEGESGVIQYGYKFRPLLKS
jgi:uncharacterized OB-fold protein